MDNATLDNRHSLALPYWARPGLALFAAPADGGGEDEGDEGDDDEGDDEDDDPDEGKTPEELRAELSAARKAIEKANGSSASKRSKLKALRGKVADLEAASARQPAGSDDDDKAPDLKALREAATREAAATVGGRIIKAEARGALRAAGLDAARVDRLVGLLALDDVDVDEEGRVDGLDEAIDDLKREWPELFAPAAGKRRRSVAGDDDRDGKDRSGPKLTASQRQGRQALGLS